MNINYNLPYGFDEEKLISELTSFLEISKSLFVQIFKGDSHQWVIQAKEDKAWKKIIAMDKAITIRISIENNVLKMMMGEEKWIDKTAGVIVGVCFAWPLLVTSAIGIFQQHQLPEEINRFVFDFINGNLINNAVNSEFMICPLCGASISSDAHFCPKCGAKLK